MHPNQLEVNTIADGYSKKSEDRQKFVCVPNCAPNIDFAVICSELTQMIGMPSLPIRIKNGTWNSFGIAHILHKHGFAIAQMDYHSIQDFVDEVAFSFNTVYASDKERWIISVRDDNEPPGDPWERLLVLEAYQKDGYYAVVSGWPKRVQKPVKGRMVAKKRRQENMLVWGCCASTQMTRVISSPLLGQSASTSCRLRSD